MTQDAQAAAAEVAGAGAEVVGADAEAVGVGAEAAAKSGAGRFGPVAWARWGWRQLTSMRTALVLLFLLALASIPGSVLPQEGIDPAAVTQYYTAHPTLAPILAKLSGFDVFGAPWFAAIYLLLFTSLAGCVLPRAYRLARSARQPPPKAPRHLGRLPQSTGFTVAGEPSAALVSAAGLLGRRRFRLRTGDGWVAAEKGYLHEVGNLLFHVALLGLLCSVAMGGLFGYKANRLLVAGDSFANTPTALDVFHPGRLVSATDLQPFSITLKSFKAAYITTGADRGQPASFNAAISYSAQYGGPVHGYNLRVNHPLNVDGVQIFLIGHGYAPVFKVTDSSGQVVFNQPVPFIPIEQAGLTSAGVIKVPDARPTQLGFAGVFLPTEYVTPTGTLASAFPAPALPRVSLVSYAGNLGVDSGPSQSVYSLDTAQMHRLAVLPRPLAPGQSITLPHGLGQLTFTGYRQWASLAITYDPGQLPALISALTALAGLLMSFMVRRRRVFVRAVTEDGQTVVSLGGLTRSDAAGGFETEFAELSDEFMTKLGRISAASAPAPEADARADDADVGDGAAGEGEVGEGEVGEGEVGDGEVGEGEVGDGEVGDGDEQEQQEAALAQSKGE
jgi:cytochrome c biogenesis protein